MKPIARCCCWLLALALSGCSSIPSAGPLAGEVLAQAHADGKLRYDVVKVDRQVLDTVLAQPAGDFAARFKKYAPPPQLPIAVGDTVSVVIIEAAAGGLFTPPLPELPAAPAPSTAPREERRPPSEATPAPRPRSPLDLLLGIPAPNSEEEGQRGAAPEGGQPGEQAPEGEQPGEQPSQGTRQAGQPAGRPAATTTVAEALAAAAQQNRSVQIPPQIVGADGGITIPFAGRVPAAGRTPEQVERAIIARLSGKALSPQVLVLVERSPANSVTVAAEGEGARRVPLTGGGDRLLQVIAAAGGNGAALKLHQAFVRLSRDGVTATIPYETLVANPAEDIYARPGDVLTIVRIPQTVSIFGATGRNRSLTFATPRLSLAEAVAQASGLRDDIVNPGGVFLLRDEPDRILKALHRPVAATATGGLSPVVYSFDFRDPASYFVAQQFPLRDRDTVFVADADIEPFQKVLNTISAVTNAVYNGFVTCLTAQCF